MSASPHRPPTRNDAIFETLEPFLVTAPWHVDCFERRPFEVAIPEENVLDPTRVETAPFFDRLSTLDTLTFGPEGMPMPRWVFYDGAELTGAIFGFGLPAAELPEDAAARLGLARGERGLVPLSMYIAIPVRPPHTWFGHNLASLNPVFPDFGFRGLATITKAMALKVFRCHCQLGATQWDSPALRIHTRFGPLDLLTAWTPAHAEAATLTYRLQVTDERLRFALGDPAAAPAPPGGDLVVSADDVPALQRLQERIEAGEGFAIVGPPRPGAEGRIEVPVRSEGAPAG